MNDLRSRADARLEHALADAPLRDPRPYLRATLKYLRERDPDAFERAIRHYEDRLIPAAAADGDPVRLWLEYARLLASLTGSGRAVEVDPTGRAVAATEEPADGSLLLHLADDAAAPAVVVRCPRETTAAQDASIELLVLGRVTASAYG